MYKIFADNELIYDSTLEDYKIGKGAISLETNKSGSFTFSVYPDHFYYDKFVRMKTIIKVTRSGKIIFRGRILNDVTDYFNNKVITCEGELGFLQDSIIRPFKWQGSPVDLFYKFVREHNAQVDEFKQFIIGDVTVSDPNDYIYRENTGYDTALSNMTSRLIDDSLGGYFYITHGEDGTDDRPTINYLADFEKINTQIIEFGSNLKDYSKTVKGSDIATAVIPLGATREGSDSKLTIASVNEGRDYVYDPNAVSVYGWIYKVVNYDDVTIPGNLLTKGYEALANAINHNITIELNAIDLHLIDKSIESFNVGDYIRVLSKPHGFDSVMLCNKQDIDLLKPDNDKLTLGYTYSTFTENNSKVNNAIQSVSSLRTSVNGMGSNIQKIEEVVNLTTVSIEYQAKDKVNIDWQGAGYVTNAGARVVFTIPLSRHITSKLLAKLTIKDGFSLRQGGNYTHGSSETQRVIPSAYTVTKVESGIKVTADFETTIDAINDDVIGIDFIGLLSFEEVVTLDSE